MQHNQTLFRMNRKSSKCIIPLIFFFGILWYSSYHSSAIGVPIERLQNKNLTSFPDDIRADVRYIYASDNFIQRINSDDVKNYKNVVYLNLRHNKITLLEYLQGISKLTKLQHLDLSNNSIRNLHLSVFKQNFHLKTLVLNNNPIKEIDNDISCPRSLETLSLKNCSISTISWKGLGKCSSLKHLVLTGNRLKHIGNEVINYLPGLKQMDVEENPLITIDLSVEKRFNIPHVGEIQKDGIGDKTNLDLPWDMIWNKKSPLQPIGFEPNPHDVTKKPEIFPQSKDSYRNPVLINYAKNNEREVKIPTSINEKVVTIFATIGVAVILTIISLMLLVAIYKRKMKSTAEPRGIYYRNLSSRDL